MSTISTEVLIGCEALQVHLNDVWLNEHANKTLTPIETNFLNYLISDANRGSVMQEQMAPLNEGGARKRQVKVIYEQRLVTNDVGTDTTPSCTSGNYIDQKSKTYDLTDNSGVMYDFKMTPSDFYRVCQNAPDVLARRIAMAIDVLKRKMDEILVQKAVALTGAFRTEETNVVANEKTVKTKFSDGRPDYNLLQEVKRASLAMGYFGAPVAIGFGELYNYFQVLDAGCCGQNGIDIGVYQSNTGMHLVADVNIENATFGFGANHFITTSMGALQLIRFNRFRGPEGIFTVDMPDRKQMVIFDPSTGLGFDLNLVWPSCGDVVVEVSLDFDLIGLPNDMFRGGDAEYGVTGVNEYIITNP